MSRRFVLLVSIACLLPQLDASATEARAVTTFNDAVERGLYKEADKLARHALAALPRSRDFSSADVRSRYFDAIENARGWARWAEAQALLKSVAQGMEKAAVPENNIAWIELYALSVDLATDMAEFSRGDRAFAE